MYVQCESVSTLMLCREDIHCCIPLASILSGMFAVWASVYCSKMPMYPLDDFEMPQLERSSRLRSGVAGKGVVV